MPGTVVVQHMPPVFTRMFAESLDRIAQVEVREARDGDAIMPGLVLIAPGDLHAKVVSRGGTWEVACVPGPEVSGHRPSADVLFSSLAAVAGDRALGLILTGMGRDGAAGLLQMRRAGARCLAQDEAWSVVFGMPKEAWEIGAAERLVGLERAVPELLALLDRLPAAASREGPRLSVRTIGIGEWAVSSEAGDVLKTYALGSCIAVLIYDTRLSIAAMIHIALPDSKVDAEKARTMPGYFADTGLPLMIEEMKRLGAIRGQVWVKLAGGASVMDPGGFFDIGKRNILAAKRILWGSSLGPLAEDTGGGVSRTVSLAVADGETTISSGQKTWTI